MAKSTNIQLRSLNIYQVFLRQHPAKNFKGLILDLERIKSLGMDVVYLLPIHPIGEENKKGTMGSPYAIKDYTSTDPSYGTMEEFKELIDAAHKIGLKVMMDIVFNHVAHDFIKRETHPEWLYKKEGLVSRKVSDWSDIIDLDFSQPSLRTYLIDVLILYTRLGIDGFRCDVASLVPLDFWLQARKEVKTINPNVIFLAESVHLDFVKYLRDQGFDAFSDSQVFEAFDILYDYDIQSDMQHYIETGQGLNKWLGGIMRQESMYPINYIKLRNLENHDQNRVAYHITDMRKLLNITGLNFFLKGATMIYMGQEYKAEKRPNLFELDPVDLTPKHMEVRNLIHRMAHLKKDSLFQQGTFKIHLQEVEVAVISYENKTSITYGIFNVGLAEGIIDIPLKDGVYQNILYPNQVRIKDGKLTLSEKPTVIFTIKEHI